MSNLVSFAIQSTAHLKVPRCKLLQFMWAPHVAFLSSGLAPRVPFFLFYIYKKLKFQKYMSVLENFKNIPRSPYGGRQGSNVIFFFFKFAKKSLEKKKRGGPVAHPRGDQPVGLAYRRQGGQSPLPRATWASRPPPRGRPGYPPIKAPALLFPPHLSPKIPQKIQKKREG